MTASKKWVTICVAAGLIAACSLAAPPGAAAALTEKNSADFDWKYEMTVKPSAEDLDGNGAFDFTEGGSGSASVLDGVLTMSGNLDDSIYYISSGDNELWPYQGFNYEDGYTFEVKCWVVSSEGRRGPFTCYPTPADSNAHAFVSIAGNEVVWGAGSSGDPPYISLDTQDNTGDWHTFRVAAEPTDTAGNEVYSVWRDDVLLRGDLSLGYTYSVNRMLFGDCGGENGGEVRIDYFRFTEGAYAPEGGSSPIPGDANLDDIVNDADASILAAHWQQTGMGWGDGDFNNDQIVNDADASILAAHWQESQEGSTSPVPEPSTLVLLGGIGLLGLVGLARRRR